MSAFFGGTDLTDAVDHFVLAFVEALLLYCFLCHYMPAQRALRWTLGSTLALGLAFELAQNWLPARGTTLLDLRSIAQKLGISIFLREPMIVFPFLFLPPFSLYTAKPPIPPTGVG